MWHTFTLLWLKYTLYWLLPSHTHIQWASKEDQKYVSQKKTKVNEVQGLKLKILKLYKKLLMNHVRIRRRKEVGKGRRGERRQGKESRGPIRKQSWFTINRPVLVWLWKGDNQIFRSHAGAFWQLFQLSGALTRKTHTSTSLKNNSYLYYFINIKPQYVSIKINLTWI